MNPYRRWLLSYQRRSSVATLNHSTWCGRWPAWAKGTGSVVSGSKPSDAYWRISAGLRAPITMQCIWLARQ